MSCTDDRVCDNRATWSFKGWCMWKRWIRCCSIAKEVPFGLVSAKYLSFLIAKCWITLVLKIVGVALFVVNDTCINFG